MYVMDALRYPFNTKDWPTKYLILFIIMLIPLINVCVAAGYLYRTVREILSGNMELPAFNFADDFMRGLFLIVVGIAYMLPVIIVAVLLALLFGDNGAGIVSLVSSVLSVTIGLLLQVALLRYALTDDTSVFTDLGGSFRLLRDNISALITYIINTILLSFIASILAPIGMILCLIPGVIVMITVYLAGAYLLARFAQDLGLDVGKSKVKNFG